MKGKKLFAAAAQEAWEEAAVLGKVSRKPLGRSDYGKILPAMKACAVASLGTHWRPILLRVSGQKSDSENAIG
jgi:hypothetical protein